MGSHIRRKLYGTWGTFIQIVLGSIVYADIAPSYMSCGGTGRGKPWPLQVADFFGYYTAGVFGWGVSDGVHMGHQHHSPKMQRQVPWYWAGGGYLESNCYYHLPTLGRFHWVPWHSSWVQSLESNSNGLLGGQNISTYYRPAEGGVVWDIFISPQYLLHAGLGACPGNPGMVRGGPPGLTNTDPILGPVDYGGKGKRILRGAFPGVPWCYPGVPTFPLDI